MLSDVLASQPGEGRGGATEEHNPWNENDMAHNLAEREYTVCYPKSCLMAVFAITFQVWQGPHWAI